MGSTPSEEETKRWLEIAENKGITKAYLKAVDMNDAAHQKHLYTQFEIESKIDDQIWLRAFIFALRQQDDVAQGTTSSSQKRSEAVAALPSSPTPLKKVKYDDGTAESVDIKTGTCVELRTRKILMLNDKMLETLQYFGREGTEELFNQLVMSRSDVASNHEGKYNISLMGHPGAGKSTLVWAVAHHVVNYAKEKVLWVSRREEQKKWSVHLFEWDEKNNTAFVYKVDNAPADIKLILADDLAKDANLLILDSPTKSKTNSAATGIAAFEWSEEMDTRRVIHVSSLGAFSLDSRILADNWLVNKKLNPWKRSAFIQSVQESAFLKEQLIGTLTKDYKGDKHDYATYLNSLDPAELVDMKFFFSGINARWFFNYTIREIKQECHSCVKRMGDPSNISGEATDNAVNSVSVDVLLDDNRSIKLYTSAYMVSALSDRTVSSKFLTLFPLVADRLGNGTPGEVFEFDFCAYVEHTHNLFEAETYLMGDRREKIEIELGTDIETKSTIRWQAGKLLRLPKGKNHSVAAQPMPTTDLDVNQKVNYWFIPEDKSQPFLDFFVLEPEENGKWKLRVIQNTIGSRHGTDLSGLKSVIRGIEEKGFELQTQVDVVFVIKDAERQNRVAEGIETQFEVNLAREHRAARSRAESTKKKSFQLNLSRVQYLSKGSIPC